MGCIGSKKDDENDSKTTVVGVDSGTQEKFPYEKDSKIEDSEVDKTESKSEYKEVKSISKMNSETLSTQMADRKSVANNDDIFKSAIMKATQVQSISSNKSPGFKMSMSSVQQKDNINTSVENDVGIGRKSSFKGFPQTNTKTKTKKNLFEKPLKMKKSTNKKSKVVKQDKTSKKSVTSKKNSSTKKGVSSKKLANSKKDKSSNKDKTSKKSTTSNVKKASKTSKSTSKSVDKATSNNRSIDKNRTSKRSVVSKSALKGKDATKKQKKKNGVYENIYPGESASAFVASNSKSVISKY